MTRRTFLALLRIWPGAGLVVLVGVAGYVLGHHYGYLARAAEEFQWHNEWEVQ